MNLTIKQLQIMNIVVRGNNDGSFVDINELINRIPYSTSKQSLQFSIRALINKDLMAKKGMEKRRGRRRIILGPTELGYVIMRG